MTSEDIALGHTQLLRVERGWRDPKQVIDLRPACHRKEERIRAHVILCWLALLLARPAPSASAPRSPDAQADILARLRIDPPPKIYQLTPASH